MDKEIFHNIVKPYTMTSSERINCLFDSLEHIRDNNIQGDYIECGVWKGGNILGIINYLEYHNILDPTIWLYDTFSGMTNPTLHDVDHVGVFASSVLDQVKCESPLQEVKSILSNSRYPSEKIRFVIGDICQTLLDETNVPEKISLLRLDTDWYESTKIELEVLWEKLVPGGILIIDDYGHWQGCRKAVDKFFKDKNQKINQIDYTGIWIKKNGDY